MANLARTGRIIALAFALIWTSSLLPCVVKADVVNIRHDNKVLNSVVSLESVDVMNNLRGGEQSSEMLLHHKAMFGNVPLLVTAGMIGRIDQDITVMFGLSGMVRVKRLNPERFADLAYSCSGNAECGRNLFDGLEFFRHAPYQFLIDGYPALTRYAERFHVNKDELLADAVLIGDGLEGSESSIIFFKNLLGNIEFLLSHNVSPRFLDTLQRKSEICKGNDQEIVWTALKNAEGGIKSPSITSLEIKKYGDTVHIRTIPDITIRDYTIGQKLVRERPLPGKVDLLINNGKYYSISINDVEKLQADINYVEKWTDDAGQQMKIAVDYAILSSIYADADTYNKGNSAGKKSGALAFGASGAFVTVDKTNILDYIVDMGTALDEQNVPETQRWLVFPAIFCGMIKKSDLKDASLSGDGTSIMRNGRIGIIDRFTVYSSNQIAQTTDGTTTVHNCIFGHPSAITFASQLTENRVIPNPDDFGDLMEGLQVYGYETIKAAGLGHFYAAKG